VELTRAAGYHAAMQQMTYAIYPPAEPGLPWLAVVLDGDTPTDTFGCADRDTAERVLIEMRARTEAKVDPESA